MVIFTQPNYYHSMDKDYMIDPDTGFARKPPEGHVGPINTGELGTSVIEGRGRGSFLQSVNAAIREGTSVIEMATSMEGSDHGVGAEAYGKDARRTLREMAEANEVKFSSVHVPTQIGNISGLGQGGFSEQQRDEQINEIKKAVRFAAEAAQGGAVVVHTGEFPRSISDHYGDKFIGYEGEDKDATFYLVDEQSGQVIQSIKKDQKIAMPVYKTESINGREVYLDENGQPTDDPNRRVPVIEEGGMFKVEERNWDYFKREADRQNNLNPNHPVTPEELMFKATIQPRIEQAKSYALDYAKNYEELLDRKKKLAEALEGFKEIEAAVSPERKFVLKNKWEGQWNALIPADEMYPTEHLNKELKRITRQLEAVKEGALAYSQQAKEYEEQINRVKPLSEYGIKKSVESLAETGLYAMDQTSGNHLKRDVFMAPEHIFPTMGYGSHPDELIELVKQGRTRMKERLIAERGLSEREAEEKAERHIKATLDTQHLGMWRRYFKPKAGETEKQTEDRFNKWYMEQIKKFEREGIIGHIHIVDGFGRGHTHVAPGQGVNPVVEAVEYLKRKGFAGTMISEAHEDKEGQIATTWRAFGSPIYASGARPTWGDVHQAYFGRNYSTAHIVGGYAPSEDWQTWSQLPLE